MRRAGQSSAISELRGQWSRWTHSVELLARYPHSRRRVNWMAYEQEHARLMRACGALAARAEDEASRALFEQLQELARPWVSERSFSSAAPEILRDLLARCRKAEQVLGMRPRRWFDPRGALGLAFWMTAIGAFCFVWTISPISWSSILQTARIWGLVLSQAPQRARFVQVLFGAAVAAVAASAYLVARSARATDPT